MLTKESIDKIINPVTKFPDVISKSDPNPAGPTVIPRLEAAVITAKPILTCSGLTTSGSKENMHTGTSENPTPKATDQKDKDSQDVIIKRKDTPIIIFPMTKNSFLY